MTDRRSTRLGRLAASATALALALTGLVAASPAQATDNPPGTSPVAPRAASDVTSDALPTAQINGVAWTQHVVGDTVYVGGTFSKARPAGAAPGTNESPRSNLMAYNLTTGEMTSFAPVVDGEVSALASSPDGRTLYVGGAFQNIDGVQAYRLAAFDTQTGARRTDFRGATDYNVKTIVATDNVVYIGGMFSEVNGSARSRLAALTPTGQLLAWAPTANDTVRSLVLTGDRSKLVAGGSFSTINGASAFGMGAINLTDGSLMPWLANQVVRDAGKGAAIYSLAADEHSVYGTGYTYTGGGNLEGAFRADQSNGALTWVEDCHGDTYGVYAGKGTVYTVSHAHYCGNVGGFPQTNPWSTNQRRALAFTTEATGTLTTEPHGYANWAGYASPSIKTWFPELDAGTVTGQGQAAWHVTGSGDYVLLAGEFPAVNGKPQQGLVRFATKSISQAKSGPKVTGWYARPTVTQIGADAVRISWPANWDMDDRNLNYALIRDFKANAPIYTTSLDSSPWDRPGMQYVDAGLAPGSTHSYRLQITDSDGNSTTSDAVSITLASGVDAGPYAREVLADGAQLYWRLEETSGAVQDMAYANNGTTGNAVTRGVAGALLSQPSSALRLNGWSSSIAATSAQQPVLHQVSVEAWVRTTSDGGGRIMGYSANRSSRSPATDRQLYMGSDGTVWFGANPGSTSAISSRPGYNDGGWHHLVGTISPTEGMTLYVDGVKVARDGSVRSGSNYMGYWRVGSDSLRGYDGNYSFESLSADIDEPAVYNTTLTPERVAAHYKASGRTLTSTVPADPYGAAVAASAPSVYWRLGDGRWSNTAADSSGARMDGSVSGAVGFGAEGIQPVNKAASFDGQSSISTPTRWNNPTVYSTELWFSTTTMRGGELIGFGSRASGFSGISDRDVTMTDTGTLRFVTRPGTSDHVIETPGRYNDGAWHHVVATQGPDGMRLYVDGSLVGQDTAKTAQAYQGYWRIGGDSTQGASTANYITATIDEVAIYDGVLSADAVKAHFLAGGGQFPNVPPVAKAAERVANGLNVSMDGSGSTDSDGTIVSHTWDFGDGTTAQGASVEHTYATAGTYQVTLTVTDNRGGTATATHSAAMPNAAPAAQLTAQPKDLQVNVDASTSTDSDGSIAAVSWTFGDGGTATGTTATHTYGAAGTYAVTVTVTDNRGATSTATQQVTVLAPNQVPVAQFTSTATDLTATLDGTNSTDADGTITAYAWDFGDGASGTGDKATHTYAKAGTYKVTLTVTDDRGGVSAVTYEVNVLGANAAPVAAFTAAAKELTVSVDGSASSDADGTITAYAWDFGDGTSGTGDKATHTYAKAGTYPVTLTVTDDRGGKGISTQQVTATAPVAFAADTFDTDVAVGWGTAAIGGAWTTGWKASAFSVSQGTGRMLMAPGASYSASLPAASERNVRLGLRLAFTDQVSGGGIAHNLDLRVQGTSYYRMKVAVNATGKTNVYLVRVVNNTETYLAGTTVAGLTTTAGVPLEARLEAVGDGTTSTLRASLWQSGTDQPATPTLTATDASAEIQGGGTIRLVEYLSSTSAATTVLVDNVSAENLP